MIRNSFRNKQSQEPSKHLKLAIFLISIFLNHAAIAESPVKLMLAYPDFLAGSEENFIIWKDGERTLFDDGNENKTFEQLLNQPDLEDQMSIPYPKGNSDFLPIPENFDPGRIRYQPFFKKMYGSTEDEVRKNLVPISWLPNTVDQKIYITSINNVHEKLQAISNELDSLPENLKRYVSKLAGTFNWRTIAGTARLSAHSFGIAIDINIDYANYWRWDSNFENNPQYRNRIPMEIVEIFEKYGFIWGGKWYHYDTMHFEYRPELLIEK